ncbi:MAG: AMP-binding protein, partial [Acidobacteria bacterium]|nr:AMP-binding protein [Acidobacteriota bacterium]
MTRARTLPQLFETSADRFASRVMMLEKRGDRYAETSYAGMRQLVHRFAAGLLSLGLKHGDRVALISEGRNDWVMAELGILYCGAVNVPVSVKIDELADLTFRLLHSGCTMAIVSRSQIGKIRAIKRDLPDLALTIVLDPIDDLEADERSAAMVSSAGLAFLADNRAAFEARWQSVAEGDDANICYTSGTTADPKGIVLTHRNYTANAEQGVAMIQPEAGWVLLNVLPWDHAFGHTCGIYM